MADVPALRSGPRPLPLHIANAYATWMGGASSLPLFLMDGLHTHPQKKDAGQNLRGKLMQQNPLALQTEVIKVGQSRFSDFLKGVDAYRHHPYQRQLEPPATFAELGNTRLLDYGSTADAAALPPVVFVPSLINPAYILDLQQDHSMMRFLAQSGLRPLLVDWGTPGVLELQFGLREYVTDRLVPLIEEVARRCGRPPILVGYCMGGNLSLAAAQLLQHKKAVSALALLATPWDFHVDRSPQSWHFLKMASTAYDVWQQVGHMPMDLLQLFFTSLDPTLADRKFRRFGLMDPHSAKAETFVAIEDWANAGPDLALNVAFDCLQDWYTENKPYNGQWQLGPFPIEAQSITLPSILFVPQHDRIVPPDSARALQTQLPHCHAVETPTGHVTMIAGRHAQKTLWHPLLEWMMEHFK